MLNGAWNKLQFKVCQLSSTRLCGLFSLREKTIVKHSALTAGEKWVRKKVPFYPNLAQCYFTPPPPQKWNEKLADLELSNQVEKLDFGFQSATLPHPPWKLKVGRFGTFKTSGKIGLQISKYHFSPTPPPPRWKWKVDRFGTFKSSWKIGLQISKYHFTPPLPLQRNGNG